MNRSLSSLRMRARLRSAVSRKTAVRLTTRFLRRSGRARHPVHRGLSRLACGQEHARPGRHARGATAGRAASCYPPPQCAEMLALGPGRQVIQQGGARPRPRRRRCPPEPRMQPDPMHIDLICAAGQHPSRCDRCAHSAGYLRASAWGVVPERRGTPGCWRGLPSGRFLAGGLSGRVRRRSTRGGSPVYQECAAG